MFQRDSRFVRSILFASTMILAGTAQAGFNLGELALQFDNLAILDEGVEGHYEGWAVVGGAPVSTGKFNVNAGGMPVEPGGGPVIDKFDAGTNITNATAIKITIEPPGDADNLPSGLVLMSGDVSGRTADLVTDVPGLATLESTTGGGFILATPSDDGVDAGNGDMGIWFLTMPGPAAGFTDLPDPGSSWRYEGWVVDISNPGSPVPYSTGRFSAADAADDNAAGCNGGGPPFPGHDFTAFHCDNILDLDTGDFVAVLSIEPEPDNLPGPFQLKPLVGAIPTDALGMNNTMSNQAGATFPTGEAKLFRLRATRSTLKNGSEFADAATEEASWGELKGLFR